MGRRAEDDGPDAAKPPPWLEAPWPLGCDDLDRRHTDAGPSPRGNRRWRVRAERESVQL